MPAERGTRTGNAPTMVSSSCAVLTSTTNLTLSGAVGTMETHPGIGCRQRSPALGQSHAARRKPAVIHPTHTLFFNSFAATLMASFVTMSGSTYRNLNETEQRISRSSGTCPQRLAASRTCSASPSVPGGTPETCRSLPTHPTHKRSVKVSGSSQHCGALHTPPRPRTSAHPAVLLLDALGAGVVTHTHTVSHAAGCTAVRRRSSWPCMLAPRTA